MAVENKYVNANIVADKLANPALSGGQIGFSFITIFELAVADSDGSVYRLAKELDPNIILTNISVMNDAITSGTDFDLGLYLPSSDGVDGAEVNKDVFADGLDLSSAHATRAAALDGMVTVNIADRYKKLYEHAGHTISNMKPSYDLALTGNTVGTAAGTVAVLVEYLQG